ncbi:TPA: transporter substrate-binding domain-containing protein [Klebsiella quasipneumoniae subsp. similipneumoniae]|nr:transporter substrate-binding domain-containing protein [Klebsiella quasipneumoniae subsp. similipneumoniae]
MSITLKNISAKNKSITTKFYNTIKCSFLIMQTRIPSMLLYIILLIFCYTKPVSAQSLKIISRENATQLNISLSNEQWKWLGLHSELKVGTWAPDNPPFDIVPEENIYEGIYADYIRLIARNLGLKPVLFRYSSRAEAMRALSQGQIDTVIDDGGSVTPDLDNHLNSDVFIANRPVLVVREKDGTQYKKNGKNFTIAVSSGYLSDQKIINYFPNGIITRFPSNQSALTCVAVGKCDSFIGNLTSASFLIERNYSNELIITDIYPEVQPGARFILSKDSFILQESINAVLQTIPEALQRVITRQWVQRQDVWRFNKPLLLTNKEQAWIKANPTIRIIVNPYFAPYTLLDNSGEVHGIAADILRLIHLRTGINFQIISANSAEQMFKYLISGKGDVIGATSISRVGEKYALYTRPWHQTPSVLVVRNDSKSPDGLRNNLTLAVVKGNMAAIKISKSWPGIQWIYAENESLVLQLVSSGKVDGGVTNQLGANYLIDRFYPNKLKIADRIDEKSALIGFAVRRDYPELLDIFNKALEDILPQEISLIVHRWQGAPDIPINTWDLYDTKFYLLTAFAASILSFFLMWVYIRDKKSRQRELVQKELQAQLNFRETLINGSPTPVYVLDHDFLLIMHNKAFQDYFKDNTKKFLNYSLFDLRHPLAPLRESLELSMNRDPTAISLGETQEFIVNNGHENRVILHWATPHINATNKTIGLICGWQDITAQKQLLLDLSIEKEHAEQANHAKSTFLATMSHEIRTPISAIIGLLELENKKQPGNEAIQVAFESSQTLMALIGDVLDMAKIESGQLELAPEWLPLSTLITPVVRVFEEVARQKGLELRFENNVESALEVFLDGSRLRQAIANYLSNAVKFTDSGQIIIRCQNKRTTNDKLMLYIEIEDTGIGISTTDQQRLFKPFSQLDAGRKQTGTGLGLVISSQLLQKMHGSMQMRSHPGRGTLILIEIPVTARNIRFLEVPEDQYTANYSQKFHILIVDDHTVNRMVLSRQLIQLGHKVTEAENGEIGFEKWKTEAVDIIITDCTMPDMDGYAMTKKIRATGSNVIIFGLTANAQSETRDKAIMAGMNDCLFKPLRLLQLETVLRNVSKSEPNPTLDDFLNMEELLVLFHHDENILSEILLRSCDECEKDMSNAWRHYKAGEWDALASCVHKLGGASQVIYAYYIDELCNDIESCCTAPVNTSLIHSNLKSLDSKVKDLQFIIRKFYFKQ